ncbi:putative invertase inhibitor [Bienertia sinuspersici]
MKTTNSSNIFLIILLIIPIICVATNLINQTCQNSSNIDPNIPFKFCVYALQSSPASSCANITRLGLNSITLIKHNVTDTRCLIKRLLDDKQDMKPMLEDCLDLYSDSISTLREVALDYRAKKFMVVNVKVSPIMEASSSCEQGFEDVGVTSPLIVQNNRIFQLCAIALSIIKTIQ